MSERCLTVLVLGATGMLGNAMVRFLAQSQGLSVVAASRSGDAARHFDRDLSVRFIGHVDARSPDRLAELFAQSRPSVVINCVGLVKQAGDAQKVMAAVPINTLLPHRLLQLTAACGARLIHISTDCVFSGAKGDYVETERADATDVYGLSKYLGEVAGDNAITLRTSIIGHELRDGLSLVEWFLAQEKVVKGFSHAIFSGVPTVELARIVRDYVLPKPELKGLYHVSAEPIAKYDLLTLIAAQYGKSIEIVPDGQVVIDRSLNSDRFRAATGYRPPSWPELIASMHSFG